MSSNPTCIFFKTNLKIQKKRSLKSRKVKLWQNHLKQLSRWHPFAFFEVGSNKHRQTTCWKKGRSAAWSWFLLLNVHPKFRPFRNWAMKQTLLFGIEGIIILHSYMGITDHEIRIPIKPPVFQWKVRSFFFSWLNWWEMMIVAKFSSKFSSIHNFDILFFLLKKVPCFFLQKMRSKIQNLKNPKLARPRIVQEALDGSRYSSHELSEEHGMMGGCYG